MKQYINKSALVAEIKRKIRTEQGYSSRDAECGYRDCARDILSFIDTLEVKEEDTWHLQEKKNIYDAVKDWSLQTFACVMKDGTIQKFTSSLDEDYEGHINAHIYGANDDYDNVDDIVKWIEFT